MLARQEDEFELAWLAVAGPWPPAPSLSLLLSRLMGGVVICGSPGAPGPYTRAHGALVRSVGPRESVRKSVVGIVEPWTEDSGGSGCSGILLVNEPTVSAEECTLGLEGLLELAAAAAPTDDEVALSGRCFGSVRAQLLQGFWARLVI